MIFESLDILITQFLHSANCKESFISSAFLLITKNSQYIWFLIFMAAFFLEKKEKFPRRLFHFLVCFSGFILSWHFCDEYLKPFFSRERPFFSLPDYCLVGKNLATATAMNFSSSFPSGHTITAFTGAFLVFFFKWRKNLLVALLGILFAFLCGYIRIFIGMHYFFDILGGIFFALLISSIWYKLMLTAAKSYQQES